MIAAIGRISLFVRDHDEALAFYRDALGFEVLYDAEPDDRGRFLHIGLPRQPGVGLWLQIPRSEEQSVLVGRQGGGAPFLVLYAEDCRAVVDHVRQRGGEVLQSPAEDGGAVVAHIADLYGNRIVIAELPAGEDGT